MCEQCLARNTATKRAAMDALFAPNPLVDADAIAGFVPLLRLARQFEQLVRAPAVNAQPDPEEVALFKGLVRSLSWQERTAAYRLAVWSAEHLTGLYQNLALAKQELRDPDVTLIDIRFGDGAIEIVKNGEVIQRIELGEGVDQAEAITAAERAMQAHRDHQEQHHPTDG